MTCDYLRGLRNTISTATGFDAGERWDTAEEVRAYLTPENMLVLFGDDAEQDPDTLDDYATAVVKHRWHFSDLEPGWWADDGNASVHYPDAEDGEAAAREYVETGYPPADETQWFTVYTWRQYTDGAQAGERERHKIAVDPDPPECSDDAGHEWSEIRLSGHGGGVVTVDRCDHCGALRTINTWAQDPEDGEQGFTSIRYGLAEED